MGLAEQLVEDMQDAMRTGDVRRRDVIRYLRAQIRNAEIPTDAGTAAADAQSGQEVQAIAQVTLDDAGIIKVIQRQVKQRQDSIDLFQKAGRQDLVDEESAQLAILQRYLPQQLDDAALRDLVAQVLRETGATSQRDMGRVMPLVIERSAGRADPRQISAMVRTLLTDSASSTS